MFIFRVIIFFIFPLTAACAGVDSSTWKPYTFDGTNFSISTEPAVHSIWTRSGHFPAISEADPEPAHSDKLLPGTGAVAGICYTQTAGGKISSQNSFTPYPDEKITLKSRENRVLVIKTDKDGYFREHLKAGSYELFCRGIQSGFTIKTGETTLVPIRGGKRMAD